MDSQRFDRLTRIVTQAGTRRGALQALAATVVGLSAPLLAEQAEAKHKHHKKKKKGLPLRALCTPGKDKCKSGLKCDSPTTRHTCSSTVEGVADWCCVPPGGKCTECDCCGNFFCDFGDANPDGACIPNPEG
jgi:hypothetical protein